MADFKGYSVNYSWSSRPKSQPEPPQDVSLWALDPCVTFQLPQQQLMVKSQRTGRQVVTAQEVYQILQRCTTFQSLETHADAITAAMPTLADKRTDTIQLLQQFIQQGIMQSAEAALTELQQGKTPVLAPLFGIIIRTCDRPAQLERLLASIEATQARFGERHKFWVFDDSRDPVHRKQNRLLVGRFSPEGADLRVGYYGFEQQQRLIKRLHDAFPQQQACIDWLLATSESQSEHFTGGRLLNHLLLVTTGQRFLILDDDIICEPYQAAGFTEGTVIAGRQPQAAFYASRESMCEQLEPMTLDPFAEHAAILGASIKPILSARSVGASALKGLSSTHLLHVCDDTRAIRTISGIAGDPGTASLSWVYEQNDSTRESLIRDPQQFSEFRSNRCLWLGSPVHNLSVDPALMMTSLAGIDNQTLLPPASPCFRNEDYLFGVLVKCLYPQHIAVDFPWGLLHYPEPARQWKADRLDQSKNTGVLTFIADMAHYQVDSCFARSPEQRMAFLAQTYLSWADCGTEKLAASIEEHVLRNRTAAIHLLQNKLDQHQQQPAYWTEDVQRLLKANGQALAIDDALIADRQAGPDRATQVATVRDTLQRMGEAMQLWPQLWHYCENHRGSLLKTD